MGSRSINLGIQLAWAGVSSLKKLHQFNVYESTFVPVQMPATFRRRQGNIMTCPPKIGKVSLRTGNWATKIVERLSPTVRERPTGWGQPFYNRLNPKIKLRSLAIQPRDR